MKLRTKLIVAFFGLAVLPLIGLVVFSYLSSVRALRQAVEEQSRELAGRIERNMAVARGEFLQNWRGVRELDWPATSREEFEVKLARAMEELGPWAPLVRRWEFQPAPPAAAPPPPGAEGSDAGTPAAPPVGPAGPEGRWWDEPTVVWVQPQEGQSTQDGEGAAGSSQAARAVEADRMWRFSFAPDVDPERAVVLARRALERVSARIGDKVREVEMEMQQSEGEADAAARAVASGVGDLHAATDAAIAAGALAVDLERLRNRDEMIGSLLGTELSLQTGLEGVGLQGTLGMQLDKQRFFRAVLEATPRDRGEVPFAVDPEGQVYFRDDVDRERLIEVSGVSPELFAEACREGMWSDDSWVVATKADPETEITYGIARPIDDSLAEIRRATGRNFLLGLGMIGLSLFGILPLSSRLTRGLQDLSTDVDRLAEGELDVRAEVRGRDELAVLARSFNHMAAQLQTQREQLVEQERRGREQEVSKRLLEAENARRGEELEQARQFQLSMLPAEIPRFSEYDIAVVMRTATEVGGDYYDFLPDPAPEDGGQGRAAGRQLTVAVGDATGHGAKAGTMVTAVKALLSASAPLVDLAEFLAHGSAVIKNMCVERMAMSLQLVRLSPEHFDLASAAMPPALLWRREAGAGAAAVEEIALEGLPLGGLRGVRYECRRVAWNPGDVLLMMSDGLLEQTGDDGSPVGYRRVTELFREAVGAGGGGAAATSGREVSADDVIRRFNDEIERITGGRAPADDVTFLAVRNISRAAGR